MSPTRPPQLARRLSAALGRVRRCWPGTDDADVALLVPDAAEADVALWASGALAPRADQLHALGAALGVPGNWLLWGHPRLLELSKPWAAVVSAARTGRVASRPGGDDAGRLAAGVA